MTPIFRPGPGPYALAMAMTGVQMGERLLQIGAGTPAMFGALAARVGLSGRAAAVTRGKAAASSLETAAAKAGVLVEVHEVAEGAGVPCDDDSFDLVVVDSTADSVDTCQGWLAEAFRVLRVGGRLIVAERYAARLRALVGGGGSPSGPSADAAAILLKEHGFRPVRKIAERDGWRFTEGMKPRT